MTLIAEGDLRKAVNVGDGFAVERLPQIIAGVESWVPGAISRQLTPLPALEAVDPPTDPPTFTDTAAPHVHQARLNGHFIRVPDAREIVTVKVDGHEVTDYEVFRHPFPANGPITDIRVFVRGRAAEVTGRFGFTALPDELREAMLAHMAHLVYQERAGFVSSQVNEWGTREYASRVPPYARMVYDNFNPDFAVR